MISLKTNTSNVSQCVNQSDFQFYLFPITYGLVLVFGLLGNLGALYLYIFKLKQKLPSSFYFLSIALVDTMYLGILPFRIHYHLNGNDWIFGDVLCRLTGILFFGNIYISITFMSCICVDRYLATVYPLTYLRLRKTRCSLVVGITIWVLCGTVILVFNLTSQILHKNKTNNCRNCFENFSEIEWETLLLPFSTICFIFGAILPLTIILVLYPVVARRIARIKTRTARGALRIIYIIMAITVICFLPFHLVFLLHILCKLKVIDGSVATNIFKARRVTMALGSMNSLFDPVLYYFATSHCKWNIKWNLKWLKPKKRRGVYTISGELLAR